jgi:hypothetical protein
MLSWLDSSVKYQAAKWTSLEVTHKRGVRVRMIKLLCRARLDPAFE